MNTHTKKYNKRMFTFLLVALLLPILSVDASPVLTADLTSILTNLAGIATTGDDDTIDLTTIYNNLQNDSIVFISSNLLPFNIIAGNEALSPNQDPQYCLHNFSNNNTYPQFAFAQQNQVNAMQGTGFNTTQNSLVAIYNDIVAIPHNYLSSIEGIGFNPSTNSLVAITNDITTLGTSRLATPSQITDIKGNNFSSADSLVAITAAIKGVNPSDLGPIEGAGFDTNQNSLVAITNDITRLGTSPLATPANLTTATAPLITSTQLTNAFGSIATSTDLTSATNQLVTSTQLTNSFSSITTTVQLSNATDPLMTKLQLTDSVNPIAKSTQLAAIQGQNFNSSANSLVAISNALADINPNTDLSQIEGTGFNCDTNSLVAITNNIKALGSSSIITPSNLTSAVAQLTTSSQLNSAFGQLATSDQLNSAVIPLTTSAQIASAFAPLAQASQIGSTFSPVTTTIQLNNAFAPVATSSSLTSINTTTSNIQNLLALVIANLSIDPVNQVTAAQGNIALTTLVTSSDTTSAAPALLTAYKTALYGDGSYTPSNPSASSALGAIKKATAPTSTNPPTQSYANTSTAISTLNTAISAFNALAHQWAIDNAGPSSIYSAAQISAALNQLNAALGYLLSQQANI